MSLYQWGGLNLGLFEAVNAVRGPVIDASMLAGTALGNFLNVIWVALVMLLLIGVRRGCAQSGWVAHLPDERRLRQLLQVFLLAWGIAGLVVTAGKLGFDMPRPYAVLPAGSVNLLAMPESPYSFPSGHAAFAMLSACVFWPHSRRAVRCLLVFAVLWVGVSRISVGAHFPADVVAG
ncbi:MAG: hypothetical protein BSR46_10990 [Candidatus Dactylopiibacterium carminicum]|nr:phosphatase PAP2 family protein [Candidatus Dactylopiibacterium carminicum]PAS98865.1 MAG: hypothetical protein BSR46_10990 [Candidatus Dactylopiibacterium carminicum]